jgi:hypothetical protein
LAKIIPYVQQRVQRHTTGIGILSEHRQAWEQLLNQLQERTALAEAMGGSDKVTRQHQRGRLTARERIATLCDAGSFNEYGALAGGNHPGGEPALAADALVGGTGRIDGRTVVLLAEDFTVKGGSIGHPNAAKRARLVRLALEQGLPLVLMLDGAGERASNQRERYPNSPGDLQLVADLQGSVPVVTLVLGISAGHGALTGMFAPPWASAPHRRNWAAPPCIPPRAAWPTTWEKPSRSALPWRATSCRCCPGAAANRHRRTATCPRLRSDPPSACWISSRHRPTAVMTCNR